MTLLRWIVYPPRIVSPPTTSTSNSDPSKNFKTTMPQTPIFNVKALTRIGDIVIYRKMTERPTVDQKGMAPITNTTNCTSCLSSYAHNV